MDLRTLRRGARTAVHQLLAVRIECIACAIGQWQREASQSDPQAPVPRVLQSNACVACRTNTDTKSREFRAEVQRLPLATSVCTGYKSSGVQCNDYTGATKRRFVMNNVSHVLS